MLTYNDFLLSLAILLVWGILHILATRGAMSVPPRPGKIGPIILKEEVTRTMLRHTISLPAPGSADVAARELAVTIDADPTSTVSLPGTAREYTLDCEHGDSVSLSLVDIDHASNRSMPSPNLVFTAADTFAPAAPGALGVTNVVEVS